MKVHELMTPEPIVLMVDDSIDVAERFMEFAHVRHLPVVDGVHLVGLVTHRDLLRASVSALAGVSRREEEGLKMVIPIVEIMNKDVSTVGPTTDVKEAIELMTGHKYGCLPVVEDDNKLVGILTEADFLKFTMRLLDQA